MATLRHTVATGGDVVLALCNPDQDFAIWDEDLQHKSMLGFLHFSGGLSDSSSSTSDENESENDEEAPNEEATNEEVPHDEKPNEKGTEFQVSSGHLISASGYFRRLLQGNWKEGDNFRSQGFLHTKLEGDAEALLILMNVIHHRSRSVSRCLSLEMLAKIAVLVDFLDCLEAVEPWLDIWINKLEDGVPSNYSRDTVLWIWISSVFKKPEQFATASKAILLYSRGPIQTLKLPIREKVISKYFQSISLFTKHQD
jgi:hypothetical protein